MARQVPPNRAEGVPWLTYTLCGLQTAVGSSLFLAQNISAALHKLDGDNSAVGTRNAIQIVESYSNVSSIRSQLSDKR